MKQEWPRLSIEQVADVNPRFDKSVIPDDLPVSFVPMPAVGAADGSIHVEEARPAREVKKGFTAFLEGDVLFAKITPCMENGKMAVVPKLVNGYGFGSTEFHVLRPKPGMDAKFLYYFVSSQSFRGEAERYMTGAVGQKRVSTTYLKESKIPVAPLNQQKRIVAEIEKQFSRLDEAVANLKRVKTNLKRYKAAVLKAAVEGRLVETEADLARKEGLSLPTPRPGVFYIYAIRCNDDSIYVGHTDNLARRWEEHLAGQAADWTKQHKPTQIVHYEEYQTRQEAADREKWLKTGYGRKWIKREIEAGRARQVGYETGEQLLQRILETRRQQWLARAEQAGGKGKGKYKEPAAPDTTDLPELPEGWVWANWEQVGFSQNGRPFPSSDYCDKGVRLLRPGNLHESGALVWTAENTRHMPPQYAGKNPDLIVKGRELVMNLTAQSLKDEFLGRVCFTADGEHCLLNQRLARLIPIEVVPEFAWVVFKSIWFRRFVDGLNTGSLIQHMFTSQLATFAFPIPPIAEQHRIVAEADRRFSLIRETEAQVDANITRAARMRQALLSDFFSGRRLTRAREEVV